MRLEFKLANYSSIRFAFLPEEFLFQDLYVDEVLIFTVEQVKPGHRSELCIQEIRV